MSNSSFFSFLAAGSRGISASKFRVHAESRDFFSYYSVRPIFFRVWAAEPVGANVFFFMSRLHNFVMGVSCLCVFVCFCVRCC